ncbi:M1-specific T cell receptor beta chain-like isoform X1 [Bufo gargarizans]|uniref:M1-specific T cell receptor beta chain-like isoform X1 n=1 Tax=Bufo gargarizans TaxID=30331 RepID=UPI001CF4C75F|nr:M1-specific T cell receptor beta chain-like isoform X1 [Bufo gargarizans]
MNFWLVLAFFTYISGIITDGNIPDLSRVHFVEEGKNINISCYISKRSSNVQWYKEREDGGLQVVSQRGCYLPKENSRYYVHCEKMSALGMEIRNVLPSDSGVYYCSLSGLDPTFHVAGTLIVTEHYPKEPTLSILESVEDHPRNTGITVLLCAAFNWTQKWGWIKWTLNGKEQEGWTTLDPDGSLKSLLVVYESIEDTAVTCFIHEATTGENISSTFPREINKSERSISDCYIVLYVGLPIIIAILLAHLIILAIRRKASSKDTHCSNTHKGMPSEEERREPLGYLRCSKVMIHHSKTLLCCDRLVHALPCI